MIEGWKERKKERKKLTMSNEKRESCKWSKENEGDNGLHTSSNHLKQNTFMIIHAKTCLVVC